MSQMQSNQQGWNPDPFRRFEQRWFSQGTPTALVRNGRVEHQDDPQAFAQPSAVGVVGSVAPADAIALSVAESVVAPVRAPATFEYRLYRRRRHRWSARILLMFVVLVPIVGLVLLVPNPHTRALIVSDYAILGLAIAVLVGVFRLPGRWSRRA
jgi:hypothetical protein